MSNLIGTAGHVDHGKTSLIRALTGIDADRLPEEKKRGMTIDIGFAYIDFPTIGRVSIVDVPGHEKFIRNMLVGALAIDVALLCIAADEGVKPQTREHLQILQLLPVEKMVVALTRADLADQDTRELATLDAEQVLHDTKFEGSPIVAVSSVSGEGLAKLKAVLAEALSTSNEKSRSGPWYLPVDRVFTVKGHGCVVTGTLAQGEVKVGDTGFIEPGHQEVRIRSIHNHEEQAERSDAGKRTALNLSGIKAEDVHRGQALGASGALFETTILDAKVRWITKTKHGQRIRISIGAEEAIGKVFLNDSNLEVVQLRLESTIACALGQSLILRRYSPPDVLGGGSVIVPQAKVRRKSEGVQTVNPQSDPVAAILETLERNPHGIKTEEICRQLGRTPQQLGNVFERLLDTSRAVGFAGLWFLPKQFEEQAKLFLQALSMLHGEHPTLAGIAREKVVQRAELRWAGKPLDRMLAHLQEEGKIDVQGSLVRLSTFHILLSTKQSAFLQRVVEALNTAGINTPFINDLATDLSVPHQAIEEILKIGIQAGQIVRIADGIFYSTGQIDHFKSQLREHFQNRRFSAGEFRDLMGSSRKYAIPFLEYLDSVKFTMRQGDSRIIIDAARSSNS